MSLRDRSSSRSLGMVVPCERESKVESAGEKTTRENATGPAWGRTVRDARRCTHLVEPEVEALDGIAGDAELLQGGQKLQTARVDGVDGVEIEVDVAQRVPPVDGMRGKKG